DGIRAFHVTGVQTCALPIWTDGQHGAVIAPIHLSTTFKFSGLNEKGRYDYTRSGNPTRDTLAATIAALEGGAAGIVTATGMAARSEERRGGKEVGRERGRAR